MKKLFAVFCTILLLTSMYSQIPTNTYQTGKDKLDIKVLGHASLLFQYKGKNIYVDPWSEVVDFSKLPKADLILITHEHQDHLDKSAIDAIKTGQTYFISSQVVKDILGLGDAIGNGETTFYDEIIIEAVPAYNRVNKRPDGEFYHPKGRGNGYVLTLDDLKVYVAGDTENIPEMENLKGKIDIAFLPKNLPYTMTDKMFTDAVKKIEPKILYPYHFSELDEAKLKKSLKDSKVKWVIHPMKNK